MIPVDQTICDFKKGNCYQACVASIFEVELTCIPNFMGHGPDRFVEIWDAWADMQGLAVFDLDLTRNNNWLEIFKGAYVVVTGLSPRDKNHYHSVVFYNGVMVHDPHPDKTGIIGKPEIATVFALKNHGNFKILRSIF